MAANHEWLEENLGPASRETLAASFGLREEAGAENPELERIEFDSEAPQGEELLAQRPEPAARLKSFVDVPWPKGLEPRPAKRPPAGEALPKADVLIVTWTVEEGHALSRVLTPGLDSQPPTPSQPVEPGMSYWKRYRKNYEALKKQMNSGCPAVNYQRLGTYWTSQIGDKSVVIFKSDSHMSQDGPRSPELTPNRLVWKQIIEDCRPDWVITTGTAGGVGSQMEVGDVIASRYVTFDPGGVDPKLEPFSCREDAPRSRFKEIKHLLEPNAEFLPKTNTRAPRILQAGSAKHGVVTTKNFAYDDTANTFQLKGKGDVCEMGDAVLGLVCKELGGDAPQYVVVRNVSDPEIDSGDPDATNIAAYIYKQFGRWSSVCSAIVCWAIVASTSPVTDAS